MTRLAILADIHGNLPALEAVMADLAQFAVDQVIVAGDVVNWGPFSAEVMARVVDAGWAAIRGNNEFYLLDYRTPRAPAGWDDRSQWPLLPWLERQLRGKWHSLIAAWPDSLCLRYRDAPPIRVVHGSPRQVDEAMNPDDGDDKLAAMLAGVEEPVVIAAHTHLPMARNVPRPAPGGAAARWTLFNPGSVGVPLDGQFLSRYLILDSEDGAWRGMQRSVALDPEPVLREFERQRFVEECGVVGELVVEEFRRARLELRPFLTWRQACCPERPLTFELLAEYRKVDPLAYVPEAYREGWRAHRLEQTRAFSRPWA